MLGFLFVFFLLFQTLPKFWNFGKVQGSLFFAFFHTSKVFENLGGMETLFNRVN